MHRGRSVQVKRALVAFVIFVAGMFAGAWLDDWLDIDTCYDRGGYFDRVKETCIY